MTRGADDLPVSDHAVLRYLQRVCGVDTDHVRRHISAVTAKGRDQKATGVKLDGIAYRIRDGYVTTVFVGEPLAVRRANAAAIKKILRRSRHVPALMEVQHAEAADVDEDLTSKDGSQATS